MATIKVTARTDTTITLKVVDLDTSYEYDDRVYHVFISGGGYDNKDINEDGYTVAAGATETDERYIIGLTALTVYDITIKFYTDGSAVLPHGTLLSTLTHQTKTLAEGESEESGGGSTTIIIEPWDWEASNGSYATAAQTQAAYDALINKRSTKKFSHKVWNDLCCKMREVALYNDVNNVNVTDSYMFKGNLLMNVDVWGEGDYTDKRLTASRFNMLVDLVDRACGTSVGTVSKGDIVKASYFLDLVDDLNAGIDAINSD